LSSMACPDVPYFSTVSYKRYDFLTTVMCILISCPILSKTFVILRRTKLDIIILVLWSSGKVFVNSQKKYSIKTQT